MKDGIFLSLSSAYLRSAQNSFYYLKQSPWLLKPVVLLLAIFYALVLVPVGLVFGAFIVFDWVSNLTENIRGSLLLFMEKQSWRIDDSFWSFLFRPILVVIVSPLFLFSLFIPKFSSNALLNISADEVANIISGAGAFQKINEIVWRVASRLFVYVANAPLFLKPFVAVISTVYSIVLIIIGVLFFILIPLDFISKIIEKMRQNIIRFANKNAENIRYGFWKFAISPLVLVIFAPLFLLALLVPKFATAIDTDTA